MVTKVKAIGWYEGTHVTSKLTGTLIYRVIGTHWYGLYQQTLIRFMIYLIGTRHSVAWTI